MAVAEHGRLGRAGGAAREEQHGDALGIVRPGGRVARRAGAREEGVARGDGRARARAKDAARSRVGHELRGRDPLEEGVELAAREPVVERHEGKARARRGEERDRRGEARDVEEREVRGAARLELARRSSRRRRGAPRSGAPRRRTAPRPGRRARGRHLEEHREVHRGKVSSSGSSTRGKGHPCVPAGLANGSSRECHNSGPGSQVKGDPMHAPGGYAESLLAELPPIGAEPPAPRLEHPALAWARSGAMALTGRAEEPPRLAPAPLATCAAAALDALRSLAPTSRLALESARAGATGLDGAALLGERAAYLGLARRGSVSAGGSCRLLRAADGWIAVSLPREDDRALIPGVARRRRGRGVRSLGRRSRPAWRSGTLRTSSSARASSASPWPRPGPAPPSRRPGCAWPRAARAAPPAQALRAARARPLGALGGAALRPAPRPRRSARGEGRERRAPRRRPLRAARLLRGPERRQGERRPRSPHARGRRVPSAPPRARGRRDRERPPARPRAARDRRRGARRRQDSCG